VTVVSPSGIVAGGPVLEHGDQLLSNVRTELEAAVGQDVQGGRALGYACRTAEAGRHVDDAVPDACALAVNAGVDQ
jgi:hypothetical protein